MNTETKSGHVHAELMAQYAEDARTNADVWKLWEWREKDGKPWREVSDMHPAWIPNCEYRRKPRTININGHEVPEPLRDVGGLDRVWAVELNEQDKCHRYSVFCEIARHAIERGLAHYTKEAAIAHAEALLSFTAEAK